MHYCWWILILNDSSRLVRAFHSEDFAPEILKSAKSTLKYISDYPAMGDFEAKKNFLAEKLQIAIKHCSVEGGADGRSAIDYSFSIIKCVEWHVFLSSGSKPEKWRNSIETALFLCGLNPVANYMPFSERYNPPNQYQLESLVSRILEVKRRLSDTTLLDKQVSSERLSRFWSLYLCDVIDGFELTKSGWDNVERVFLTGNHLA